MERAIFEKFKENSVLSIHVSQANCLDGTFYEVVIGTADNKKVLLKVPFYAFDKENKSVYGIITNVNKNAIDLSKIKVEVSIPTNKEMKKVSIWITTDCNDYNPDNLKLLKITDYED